MVRPCVPPSNCILREKAFTLIIWLTHGFQPTLAFGLLAHLRGQTLAGRRQISNIRHTLHQFRQDIDAKASIDDAFQPATAFPTVARFNNASK